MTGDAVDKQSPVHATPFIHHEGLNDEGLKPRVHPQAREDVQLVQPLHRPLKRLHRHHGPPRRRVLKLLRERLHHAYRQRRPPRIVHQRRVRHA
eukprot:CAMPEP_0185764556 /NCGR_PEP_ID=MMETSP1174-20130828/23513_1 /TAXON_ID=35687 /ORGANISM="Dictyocha speculum, Strain CCMP1381" /LENGTH=93 /DNA_ID=CAMNT_0028447133 /DNA_START=339 /DNA_END=616 /DNA_ORIENTATION=+